MNGDVESRAQAEKLITEFGVDGAMIATAAETNSSCFRSAADGGLVPWREVVERYIQTSLEVENRFGNTKYLLGQLVPGKQAEYREMTGCKSYHQVCSLLGFKDLEPKAKEVDEKLGLTPEVQALLGKRGRKNKSAMAAGGNPAKKARLESTQPLSKPDGAQATPAQDIEQPAVIIEA